MFDESKTRLFKGRTLLEFGELKTSAGIYIIYKDTPNCIEIVSYPDFIKFSQVLERL